MCPEVLDRKGNCVRIPARLQERYRDLFDAVVRGDVPRIQDPVPSPPMLEAAGTCQAFQDNNGRWVWGQIPTTEPEDGAKKAVGVPAAACQPLKVKHLPL